MGNERHTQLYIGPAAKIAVDQLSSRHYDVLMTDRAAKNQGMNWIRPEKRLAIYMRDGLACVWCEASVEDGTKLTLDHLKPYSKGGNHSEKNLVTCCHRCNSSRGNRSVKAFAVVVAAYLNNGVKPDAILAHIKTTSKIKLDVSAAKSLIAKRGGFVQACKG